jgi:hypothetical protein
LVARQSASLVFGVLRWVCDAHSGQRDREYFSEKDVLVEIHQEMQLLTFVWLRLAVDGKGSGG